MRGMGICLFGEERMVSECEELERARELEGGSSDKMRGVCMGGGRGSMGKENQIFRAKRQLKMLP